MKKKRLTKIVVGSFFHVQIESSDSSVGLSVCGLPLVILFVHFPD